MSDHFVEDVKDYPVCSQKISASRTHFCSLNVVEGHDEKYTL